MKIQTYDTPRVAQQGISGGEKPMLESTVSKIAPYAQKAVGMVAEAKQEADTYRAEDAYNQLQEKKTQLWAEVQTKQGENALNVHDDFIAKYDEEASNLKQKMGRGAADMFAQAHARGRSAFSSQLAGYQTQQIDISKEKTNLAGITLETQDAWANAGTPLADQNVARTSFLLNQEADRRGLGGDARDLFVQDGMSAAHSNVIQGLLDKNYPVAAQDYLKAHESEFTRKDFESLDKKVRGVSIDSASVDMAREALDAAQATGKLDKATGYDLIDKQAGSNKDLRDKAMAEFDHGFGVYTERKKSLDDQDVDSVSRMVLAGASPAMVHKAILNLPSLDDGDKLTLGKKIDSYYKGDPEDRAAAREAKRDRQESIALQIRLNPNQVYQMQPQDFVDLLPVIGAQNVSGLVSMKEAMVKKGPESFQVDADTFNDLATKAGLDPKNKANTGVLLDAKAKIEKQIADEQASNKMHPNLQLDPERRAEIARYWLSDVLTKGNGGFFGSDTTTKKRFQVENVNDIISSIPPEHMGGIVDYLQQMSVGRSKAITLSDLSPDEIVAVENRLYPKVK